MMWAGRLDKNMATRKRHTPEQVVRKLEAMVAKDGTRLRELLHLRFSWKSHKG